jgi:hypothetical protein
MRTALPAIAALAVAAGCQNPSTSVVGAEPGALPDLRPAEVAPAQRSGPATRLDGTPVAPGTEVARSATEIDRSGWQPVPVAQPRGQVEVQPTYYRLFEGFSEDARAQGRWPTAATALATHGESGTAVQDGFAAPVIGIAWLAGVPVQLVLMPPNTVRHQPDGGIEWLPVPAAAPAEH